jgi:hypothetical protein
MAATNFTPISLYYSATATNVPTAGNLVAGELALNTADGKLFYKDSSGVVQTIASKAGPAFSVYPSGGQTVSNATFTKVQFNNETFDTANAFDSTTNYRFQPLIAGYYQINGISVFSIVATGISQNAIYKNGSAFQYGPASTTSTGSIVSAVVYLNGSTDYLELWAYQSSGISATLLTTSTQNQFSGSLIRVA